MRAATDAVVQSKCVAAGRRADDRQGFPRMTWTTVKAIERLDLADDTPSRRRDESQTLWTGRRLRNIGRTRMTCAGASTTSTSAANPAQFDGAGHQIAGSDGQSVFVNLT